MAFLATFFASEKSSRTPDPDNHGNLNFFVTKSLLPGLLYDPQTIKQEAPMAIVILNPVFTSISGAVGRMVFYKRYGKTVMRAYIIPPNPNTPAQQKNRSRFRDAMASWQGLSADEKIAYNAAARKPGITGHNLYISLYMKKNGNTDCVACSGEQEYMDVQTTTGSVHVPVALPAADRGIGRYMNTGSTRPLRRAGGGPAVTGDTATVKFGLSNEAALSSYFAPSNASDTLYQAFRSVTAPSTDAFSLPAGTLPPRMDRSGR